MPENNKKVGLGTSAVFFTAISTILGAIMFLRFGYAVGHLGFLGALAVILVGHIVTIPTAMAIAEIATNQKVEGGGEYYIISRSFGLNIGGAIGVALFLSQAISVAFYIIAFAQAFDPVFDYLEAEYSIPRNIKLVTIPSLIGLFVLVLKKGADIGMKALYIVVSILFLSLILFFLGDTPYNDTLTKFPYNYKIPDHDSFITVFAICFPGFTGMTAGVGLSGDLKNPSKSIPIGTLAATLCGMLVYIAIIWKLSLFVDPVSLADPDNQLIMSQVALWGPIIPIGLAAATFSSALGSVLVAPRTLQALGQDDIFPLSKFNTWVARGTAIANEPVRASIITAIIAFGIVLIGDVNFVAEIISMFFMVTYGAICLISFFEHFAADPAYRPNFRSKWYLSLIGAVSCIILMFQMNPAYAILAIVIMVIIFYGITYGNKQKQGMTAIFQGVIFQLSRQLQVFLQKVEKDTSSENWRPSVVCVSSDSFDRFSAFELLSWISKKYGFGTYIHKIEGYLSKDTFHEANEAREKLIRISENLHSNVFIETLVSPSFTSAIAQVVQLPGVSGKANNMLMFEFDKTNPASLEDFVDNFQLIKATEFDVAVLATSIKGFGLKKEIHVWITSKDYENANLMILLSYIIMGHRDWENGSIKIFALYPEEELREQKKKIASLIKEGRLHIAQNNIELIKKEFDKGNKTIINERSKNADLTIIGFRNELVKNKSTEVFKGYEGIGDILFINTNKQKEIK